MNTLCVQLKRKSSNIVTSVINQARSRTDSDSALSVNSNCASFFPFSPSRRLCLRWRINIFLLSLLTNAQLIAFISHLSFPSTKLLFNSLSTLSANDRALRAAQERKSTLAGFHLSFVRRHTNEPQCSWFCWPVASINSHRFCAHTRRIALTRKFASIKSKRKHQFDLTENGSSWWMRSCSMNRERQLLTIVDVLIGSSDVSAFAHVSYGNRNTKRSDNCRCEKSRREEAMIMTTAAAAAQKRKPAVSFLSNAQTYWQRSNALHTLIL